MKTTQTRRVAKISTSTTAMIFVFLINPLYLLACLLEPDTSDYEYSQQDMERELEDAQRSYTVQGSQGAYEITLSLAEVGATARLERAGPSPLAQAHACGYERSFVRGAEACASLEATEMAFDGAVTVSWIPNGGEPEVLVDGAALDRGFYVVDGTVMDNGQLNGELALENGDTANFVWSTPDGDGANFTLETIRVRGDREQLPYEVEAGELVE